MDELDNALRVVDSAQKDLERMVSKSEEAKTALIQTARQTARTFTNTDCHEVFNASIEWGTYGKLQDEHSDADNAECMQQAKSLVLELSVLTTELQDGRDYEQKRLHQLTTMKQHIVMIDEKTEVLVESGARSERLEQALGIVETKRKKFIENILDEISADVDALYRKMHPDEGIGNLRMRLAANQKGSLHYEADFGGQSNIQPQAYYSESHLDTLGICVFLALAKRYADESMIVILDDVFTSVDQRHLGRIVDTLHDEGNHFNQIIMTTHYRPWRDRYRNARGPGGKMQLLELRPWRIETGIAHDNTKLDADELRHVLASHPFDRQSVASKAGVLLESILDFLALKYRCRVPRLPEPVYTLSELLHSMNNKLKKALRIEVLKTDGSVSSTYELAMALRDLEEEAFVRNQVGAHYNKTGASLSDAEVRGFGEHTITFADLLICSNCGSMPIRDHSGSYWECSCKQNRLHPLNQPK